MAGNEFKQRRKRLTRRMKKNSVAILPSAEVAVRNRDVEWPYRQHSDFHYLTGFDEPEAVAVLAPGRPEGEFILFCREFDATKAIWTGKHAGLEGAVDNHGADQACPVGRLAELLPGLLENRERVYYPVGASAELDGQIRHAINEIRAKSRSGTQAPTEFIVIDKLLHEHRLFKSEAELALIRRAAEISAQAHVRAMRFCRPGIHEYEIEAEFLHEITRHGLRAQAYPAIVAGGNNACVLHYTGNSDVLRDGDLLLIDAGAECDSYAADITRTYPVNGHFSEPQRLLYELVLAAQLAAIDTIKPGKRWNDPHDTAVKVLTKGLVELGLLKGKVGKLIKDEAYKPYYMHRTGHWLGMDVHDVGEYRDDDGEWRKLEPGMVMTVEPGLYIDAACDDVDPQWRGIGIRIEDDVVVTESGCEILTGAVPKAVADIEALMGESR
ncbi:MAG: Xaa-Pro aminopeptidase [Methylococcaceae bacterium]|nr:Xaa-Pro aminopeptidase [Methylococcaceae bacterium]